MGPSHATGHAMLHTLYGQAMKHDVQFFGAHSISLALHAQATDATPNYSGIAPGRALLWLLRLLMLFK